MAVEQLLLLVFVIFALAKGLGILAQRLHIPDVVGEILAGVLLAAAAAWLPLHLAEGMEVVHFLAEVGVVFLLFAVGLETPLHELARAGRTAMGVAVAGVAVPLVAGAGLGLGLGLEGPEALFLGVALVATSVGITARVLSERGMLDSWVARVILAAAIVDDVIGLLVLAVAKGIAVGGTLPLVDLAVATAVSLGFVGAAMLLGPQLVKVAIRSRYVHRTTDEEARRLVTVLAIVVCLGLSVVAAYLGLAALIGAFFAGMAFSEYRERFQLEHAVQPLTLLLTPLFFAFVGLQLDLGAAAGALGLAFAVTAVAVVTKLVPCTLAAWRQGGRSALAVGAGMVPRGEVGIVVAIVGLQAGVVGAEVYAVVITMAVLTTMLGPSLLHAALRWSASPPGPETQPADAR